VPSNRSEQFWIPACAGMTARRPVRRRPPSGGPRSVGAFCPRIAERSRQSVTLHPGHAPRPGLCPGLSYPGPSGLPALAKAGAYPTRSLSPSKGRAGSANGAKYPSPARRAGHVSSGAHICRHSREGGNPETTCFFGLRRRASALKAQARLRKPKAPSSARPSNDIFLGVV